MFDFIKACYEHWNDKFRFLMLSNASRAEIKEQIARVDLPDDIVINQFVPHSDMPRYLSLGDFALNPVKPVPTKRYCTSIKDGEYWAMGLPVVITPHISDDSEIIDKNSIGYVFRQLNKEEYIKAVETIEELLQMNREELREKIRSTAIRYRSYANAQKIYNTIYHKDLSEKF